MSTSNLVAMFFETADRLPDRPALAAKVEGEYRARPYRAAAEQVRRLGAALVALGLKAGDRVALYSENRPEWALTDLGAYAAGGVVVPIYGTLSGPQVEYILHDCGARIVVVSDPKRLETIRSIRAHLPELQHVFFVGTTTAKGVEPFETLLSEDGSTEEHRQESERRLEALSRDDLATIVYTSGTTGEPKGAMLTHGNILANLESIDPILRIYADDVFLSFLPLSHIFERTCGHYLPLRHGASIHYAESIFTVARNMEEVRPTVMLSVPRLYENMQKRVFDAAAKASPLQRRLFTWAYTTAVERVRRKHDRRGVPPQLRAQTLLADRLVLRRVRKRIQGRVRFFISGGAALPRDTAEFFLAMGLTLLQGYGLTETAPVISCNRLDDPRPEGVGPALGGVEVKFAGDGEICVRGAAVFKGYWNKPEETQEAIDAEGWFHTGDVGLLTDDGHIHITDRKKNLLVLSTGKKVAPQPIEMRLKTSPFIADVLLIGDRRSAVGALIVPNFDALIERDGLPSSEPNDLVAHPEVRRLLRSEIDRLTGDLAEFERVKRFAILGREFSMDQGEVTPTLKLRRTVILEHFADQVREVCRD